MCVNYRLYFPWKQSEMYKLAITISPTLNWELVPRELEVPLRIFKKWSFIVLFDNVFLSLNIQNLAVNVS